MLFVCQAFQKISGYLDYAKSSDEMTILAGGTADDRCTYIHVYFKVFAA